MIRRLAAPLFIAACFVASSFAQTADTSKLDKAIAGLGKRIEVVKVVVEKSGSVEAAAVLAKGVGHYNKAIELNVAGKEKAAWAELNTAVKLVARAAAIANGQTNIDQAIKRVGIAIEKAKVIVEKSGNERAAKVLAEAVVHYNKAIELNTAGKPREAVVELRIAENLIRKAVEIALAQNTIDMQIKRVGTAIEKATPIVEKSTNERAKKALAEGIASYNKAIALNKENKIREAKVALDIAAKLVATAVKLAQE